MHSDKTEKARRGWLTPPDYANVAIRIRLDEFLKFSGRMDAQLAQLEARWGGHERGLGNSGRGLARRRPR